MYGGNLLFGIQPLCIAFYTIKWQKAQQKKLLNVR